MRLLVALGCQLLALAPAAPVAGRAPDLAEAPVPLSQLTMAVLDARRPDGQRTAAEQLLARDKKVFSRVAESLAHQVGRQHQAYLAALYASGAKMAQAKAKKADPEQLKVWSRTLQERKIEKDSLQKAWPAMEGLRAALTVGPEEIREADAELPKQRAALLQQIEFLAWCRLQAGAEPTTAKPPTGARNAKGKPGLDAESPSVVLEREEQLLAMMCLAVSDADRRILEDNWRARNDAGLPAALGIADVNVMRLLMRLKPLRQDARLCAAAHGHSADMVREKFFSHESPVPGKKTPWERAKAAGTKAAGECIYRGNRSAFRANRAWFHSPGHHAIMFAGAARRLGMGVEDNTWTLMTGR